MAGLSIIGEMKVSTLQEGFLKECPSSYKLEHVAA